MHREDRVKMEPEKGGRLPEAKKDDQPPEAGRNTAGCSLRISAGHRTL